MLPITKYRRVIMDTCETIFGLNEEGDSVMNLSGNRSAEGEGEVPDPEVLQPGRVKATTLLLDPAKLAHYMRKPRGPSTEHFPR